MTPRTFVALFNSLYSVRLVTPQSDERDVLNATLAESRLVTKRFALQGSVGPRGSSSGIVAASMGGRVPAAIQETTSSTLDGVFTPAQARRGGRVYNQNCSSCHGQGLRGGEMAPSVAGADFIVFWTEVSMSSLNHAVAYCTKTAIVTQVEPASTHAHARIPRIGCPSTSASRKSRPPKR